MRISGDISGDDQNLLVNRVTDLLGSNGARIVLDLSGVPFINSAGLSDLVRITAQANVQEGRVVLAGASPFVTGLFETTRLNRFFDLSASVDQAVAALNG